MAAEPATPDEGPFIVTGLEFKDRGTLDLFVRELALKIGLAQQKEIKVEYSDRAFRKLNVMEHRIANGRLPLDEYFEVLGNLTNTIIFLHDNAVIRVSERQRVTRVRAYALNASPSDGLTFARAQELHEAGRGDAYIDFGRRSQLYTQIASEFTEAFFWHGLTPTETSGTSQSVFGIFFEVETSLGTYHLALTAKGLQGLNVDYQEPLQGPLASLLMQSLPPSIVETFNTLGRLPVS
ncbi:MAG: hypothetical protein ACFBZ8_10875 [Opitutales bacterium]